MHLGCVIKGHKKKRPGGFERTIKEKGAFGRARKGLAEDEVSLTRTSRNFLRQRHTASH